MSEEVGYLNHISRFRMLSGVGAAIRKLNEARLPVVVVTNQSGVGRGYFLESLAEKVHQRLVSELAAEGARLDGVYYCPHVEADECSCRKPKTGMLRKAALELRLDLRTPVFGDRGGDLAMAHRARCKSALVRTGSGEGELALHEAKWSDKPDFVTSDLAEAVEWILGEAQR